MPVPTEDPGRRARRLYTVIAVLLTAVVAAGPPDVQRPTAVIGASGAATWAVLAGLRRYRPTHRAPWALIACAMGMCVLFGIAWEIRIRVLHIPESDVGILHVSLLVSYALLICSFWLIARRMSIAADRGALLDVALLVVGGGVVVEQLVLGPIFAMHDTGVWSRLLLASYPVMDLCMIMLLLRILMTPGRRPPALLLLVATFAAQAVVDIVDAGVRAAGAEDGMFLDAIGAFVSILLIGRAALSPSMARLDRAPSDETPRLGWWRLSAIGVALALPGLTATLGGDDGGVVFLSSLVVMVGLVLTRVRLLFSTMTRLAREVARREEYFRALVENVTDVVVVTDRDGRVIDQTESAAQLFATDGPMPSPQERAHADDSDLVASLLEDAAAAPGRPVHGQARFVLARGDARHYDIVVRDLTHSEAVGGVVWALHDVSDQKALENDLRYQALHDPLTGLPNRALFLDRLSQAAARRDSGDIAVMFIDLDDFKTVNDTLGHDAGDELLSHVAARFHGVLREGDTVARLGGDEFAVLVESSSVAYGPGWLAQRLLDVLRPPLRLQGHDTMVGASIGVAVVPRSDADDAVRRADLAMYHAKAAGKNVWMLFEDNMDASPQPPVAKARAQSSRPAASAVPSTTRP